MIMCILYLWSHFDFLEVILFEFGLIFFLISAFYVLLDHLSLVYAFLLGTLFYCLLRNVLGVFHNPISLNTIVLKIYKNEVEAYLSLFGADAYP